MTTTPDIPNLNDLNTEQLIAWRAALDVRLEEERQRLMQQAEALGMACSLNSGPHKKKKGRPRTHEAD